MILTIFVSLRNGSDFPTKFAQFEVIYLGYKTPFELQFLMSFLPYGVLQRDSIKTFFEATQKTYAYRKIKTVEAAGYISSHTRKIKESSRYSYSITFVSLTIKGLSFIHSKLFGDESDYYFSKLGLDRSFYDYLSRIPDAIASFGFSPNSAISGFSFMSRNTSLLYNIGKLKLQERILELANIISNPFLTVSYSDLFQSDPSISSVMEIDDTFDDENMFADSYCEADDSCEAEPENCEAANIDFELLRESGTLVAAILKKAEELYYADHPDNRRIDIHSEGLLSRPVFISRKSFLRSIDKSTDMQYSLSLCNGIILREVKPLLTFHTGLSGTAWSKKGTTKLRDVFRSALTQRGMDGNITDGVLFCRNVSQFRNTIIDKAGKRLWGKQQKSTEIGDGLHNLYCIIEIPEASAQLNLIVGTQDPKSYISEIVLEAIPTLSLVKDSLFPFRDDEENPYFNGMLMEVKSIGRLAKLADSEGQEFTIICFDWQKNYYVEIFPHAKYLTVSSE